MGDRKARPHRPNRALHAQFSGPASCAAWGQRSLLGVPLDLGDREPLHEDVGAARLRGREGEVHTAEALRELLLERRPEKEPIGPVVAVQLLFH